MNIFDLLVLVFYLCLVLAGNFLEAVDLIFRAVLYLPRKVVYLLCKHALVILQMKVREKEPDVCIDGSQEQARQNVFTWRHGLDMVMPNEKS